LLQLLELLQLLRLFWSDCLLLRTRLLSTSSTAEKSISYWLQDTIDGAYNGVEDTTEET
jgi:hypothetical protein